MNKLVSVIISVYNSEKYLQEAIESILYQTYTNLELIIINDGSTDNSLEIIKLFMEKDNRIVLIDIENSGISKARNLGVEISKGEYIAVMDSDDISMPKRIEKQLNFLLEKDIDFCGSWIETIGDTKGSIWRYPIESIDIKYCMLLDTSFAHPSVFIKSSILKKYKYNHKYLAAIDYELWTRLLVDGFKASNINEVLLKYRIHSAQTITLKSNHKNDNFNLSNDYYIDNFDLPLPFNKSIVKKMMNRNTVFDKVSIENVFKLEEFILNKIENKETFSEYFLGFYKKHLYLGSLLLVHILKFRAKYNLPIKFTFIIELLILIFFSKRSFIYKTLKKVYTWFK